ncbi:unnamed protein product [Parnassius apollo]|uniref:(apollo) hypothetical protein n=1 Tax=Parnassius apollo TaxID=110799 RepID=A0A8S3WVC9_PARAO|nr:unnamed protein product [Parnassius apollo]
MSTPVWRVSSKMNKVEGLKTPPVLLPDPATWNDYTFANFMYYQERRGLITLVPTASILVPYIYPVDPNLFEVRRQIRF